jgi:hypothetical protein
MINDREEFEYSVESLAKMYNLRDRVASRTIGHPSTREAEVDGIVSMIRKIEREIAAYLATHAEEMEADEATTDAPSRERVAA